MKIAQNFLSIVKTKNLENMKRDLEQSQKYNETLSNLNDDIRCFKHDFSNIVSAIGGYVQAEDMSGLKKYYSGLMSDCKKINNLSVLSPEIINEPAVYSILSDKYYLADKYGITVNLDIFMNLTELNMKIYDFAKILGILMDNAIEAAKECNDKIINVCIRKDFKSSKQILLIENTYLNKKIDTQKIYEKGFSSKPHNTGFGLWEVKQILKKNNNLNLYTTKDSKFFRQQLEINS